MPSARVLRRRLRRLAHPLYLLTRVEALAVRVAFARLLHRLPPPPAQPPLDAVVYSVCGRRQVPEQVASIRSFLRHAGRPRAWTVVSDGTITPAQRAALARVAPEVRVVDAEAFALPRLPALLRGVLGWPFGAKLAGVMALEADGPTIYSDSDVLFFPRAAALRDLVAEGGPAPWFLVDCQRALDDRMLRAGEDDVSINSGFFVLFEPLDWAPVVDRLAPVAGDPAYFTEQTALHLAMRFAGGRPLDRGFAALTGDDAFVPGDAAPRSAGLRHYVGPVRHKLWAAVGRGALRRRRRVA